MPTTKFEPRHADAGTAAAEILMRGFNGDARSAQLAALYAVVLIAEKCARVPREAVENAIAALVQTTTMQGSELGAIIQKWVDEKIKAGAS